MSLVELTTCPSCQKPLDTAMRQTNVRVEQGKTALSCPTCGRC
jgi:hypothetical protein